MRARPQRLFPVLLLIAGCMAPPPASQPPMQVRITEANARAAALARGGDDAGAARQYEEALRLARSIEDADAIAASAINLSILYQWLGRLADARERLAVVLDEQRLVFSERRRLQAALRRAMLDLALRDPDSAAEWVRWAEEGCERTGCELRGAILNVRAQVALERRRPEEAAQLAQRAAEAARARGDKTELANALRLTGRARRALGDPDGALRALEEALALDRALADSRKILADLSELGAASMAKGDRAAARGYFVRALDVSFAARNAASVEAMTMALRELEGR